MGAQWGQGPHGLLGRGTTRRELKVPSGIAHRNRYFEQLRVCCREFRNSLTSGKGVWFLAYVDRYGSLWTKFKLKPSILDPIRTNNDLDKLPIFHLEKTYAQHDLDPDGPILRPRSLFYVPFMQNHATKYHQSQLHKKQKNNTIQMGMQLSATNFR